MSIIYASTIFPLLFKEREGRKILFDNNVMWKYMWSVFRKVENVEKKHNIQCISPANRATYLEQIDLCLPCAPHLYLIYLFLSK